MYLNRKYIQITVLPIHKTCLTGGEGWIVFKCSILGSGLPEHIIHCLFIYSYHFQIHIFCYIWLRYNCTRLYEMIYITSRSSCTWENLYGCTWISLLVVNIVSIMCVELHTFRVSLSKITLLTRNDRLKVSLLAMSHPRCHTNFISMVCSAGPISGQVFFLNIFGNWLRIYLRCRPPVQGCILTWDRKKGLDFYP